jgi:hypothetical protein
MRVYIADFCAETDNDAPKIDDKNKSQESLRILFII